MQTPDTPRGRETERLMLLWRKQNPDADASAYNREWSATYEKLEGFMEPRYIVKDDGFHPVPSAVIDTPPKRRREKRICKADYPATKGAFGKPKHLRRR